MMNMKFTRERTRVRQFAKQSEGCAWNSKLCIIYS